MLITSSHTPNCLRQIALAFLFLVLFSCARNQKLLFFFQSFKKRYFIFTRLCLFRRLNVIALAVDHVIILFRRNLHCTQVLAVLQVFHPIFFDTEQPCSRPRFRRRLWGDSAHRNTDSPRERGLFYSLFPYVVFFNSVQFSWINPSEHTRIGQRVPMLSASGRLRVFSLCGGSPLVWRLCQARRCVARFRLLSYIILL